MNAENEDAAAADTRQTSQKEEGYVTACHVHVKNALHVMCVTIRASTRRYNEKSSTFVAYVSYSVIRVYGDNNMYCNNNNNVRPAASQ